MGVDAVGQEAGRGVSAGRRWGGSAFVVSASFQLSDPSPTRRHADTLPPPPPTRFPLIAPAPVSPGA
jgi:hypothetical protein